MEFEPRMDTDKHGYQALKAQNMIAQGAALGFGTDSRIKP
jgi:hypothetical protein